MLNYMTDSQHNVLLTEHPFLLVDFYANWCEPCKLLDEILELVKADLQEKIFIQKIDVDQSKELSQKYHVRSVPVLILFKNGKQVWRINGFLTASELLKEFKKHI